MTNFLQISFQDSTVSKLIKHYLSQNENVEPLYRRFPSFDNLTSEDTKKRAKDFKHRAILSSVLRSQHKKLSSKQKEHLEALEKPNSVTITTGHQLNLMTGPLYFFYKILHVVKLCDFLNTQKEAIRYVPIFWMATEDHDLEEVNYFQTYNKKYTWETKQKGAVGRMSTENMQVLFSELENNLPSTTFGQQIINLFKEAYLKNKTIAEATRTLVQRLLGEYGVLILDADEPSLKHLAIEAFKKDLESTIVQDSVKKSDAILKDYKSQAFARETNLFYLTDTYRSRIIAGKNEFFVHDKSLKFSHEEILERLHRNPERFSPNVILRPLYQEIILPNIGYVGGGGEIAYWLQLKGMFEAMKVNFPMLMVRNSFALSSKVQFDKAIQFKLLPNNLFTNKDSLIKEWVINKSILFEALDSKEKELEKVFEDLNEISIQTDSVFENMLKAQKQKQINGFKKLKKRLVKAEKLKFANATAQIDSLYNHFYPNGSWQERSINFIPFYLEYGEGFIQYIYDAMPTDKTCFNVLVLNAKT